METISESPTSLSQMDMDVSSQHPLFIADECPIPWPPAQAQAVHPSYPFQGVDPEAQPLDEFAYRKYLDTLWLPESLFPLEGLIQELRRAYAHLHDAPGSEHLGGLHALVATLLLSSKQLTEKYDVTIPEVLHRHLDNPRDEEERMINHVLEFEKEKPNVGGEFDRSNALKWLTRFRRREAQIQILLRLLLLSYPDELQKTPSPKKRKRHQGTRHVVEESLERLLDLTSAWIAFEDPDPTNRPGDDDSGWAGVFCETVVAPLFKDKLPGEYDMCIFSLCPAKYNTPPSSEASSPLTETSMHLDPEDAGPSRYAKSRSPSLSTEPLTGPDSRDPSPFLDNPVPLQRSKSRSLSRTRSASVFSLGGGDADDLNGKSGFNINRGGIGTSKQLFREVEMRKSTKDLKEKSKPKPKPAKRIFSRSITAPVKKPSAKSSAPMLLVAETPATKRYRTTSPAADSEEDGLMDPPDALVLHGDAEMRTLPKTGTVFVPETPVKSRT